MPSANETTPDGEAVSWMVACAAVATHPPISLAVPMTSCALTVEQLKQHLLAAVENGKCEVACDVLSELEKSSITKEILESTRVGATVNEVRKKTADIFPVVSKRCRALIKAWQKLVEVRPASSTTSSANGTPNLVSPSLAKLQRRVTPGTPVNRRITSTGLAGSAVSSATVSPANGSYAPKQLTSPSNGVLHKSQSVGADLAGRVEDPRNGKRKLEESAGNGHTSTPSSGMKRTKTAIGSLASPITPTVSVLAARKAVQSTKDLVAELSQNLPEHMSIDSSIREHEERVKREQQDEEYALQLYGGASTSTPYSQPERKKRKYERKMKPSEPSAETNTAASGPARLILRLPRVAPVKEEVDESEIQANVSCPLSSATSSRPASSAATAPNNEGEERSIGSQCCHRWKSCAQRQTK
ncbi:transcription elongation factor S-II protein [Ancylostoma duodenale]|uniref:Mediator of RNA polymerase II transcription subunit 26 n=1 Tax=Ancylostoma duodenale TaxID=51022 RepID=A0A0C2FZ67_9BILA|nr:transcription elongation factor S-II protein [Ancylostoma duodenale]